MAPARAISTAASDAHSVAKSISEVTRMDRSKVLSAPPAVGAGQPRTCSTSARATASGDDPDRIICALADRSSVHSPDRAP